MPQRLALEIRGLTIRNFDHGTGEKVFDSLSLDLFDGESFGWLSLQSFASHSFLEALSGARFFDQGSVSIFGTPIEKSPEHAQRFMGFVPKESLFDPELSLETHLRLFGDYFYLDRVHIEDRIYALSKTFELENCLDKGCADLSELEQRKASLVRALLHSPQVLVVEEPYHGLDAMERMGFQKFLVLAREAVRTFMVLASDSFGLDGLFDRIGLFTDGQLKILGSPQLLAEKYLGTQVAELFVDARERDYFLAKFAAKNLETLVSNNRILIPLKLASRDIVLQEIANSAQFGIRPANLGDLLNYVSIRGHTS